jgi:hypothetical protein
VLVVGHWDGPMVLVVVVVVAPHEMPASSGESCTCVGRHVCRTRTVAPMVPSRRRFAQRTAALASSVESAIAALVRHTATRRKRGAIMEPSLQRTSQRDARGGQSVPRIHLLRA